MENFINKSDTSDYITTVLGGIEVLSLDITKSRSNYCIDIFETPFDILKLKDKSL